MKSILVDIRCKQCGYETHKKSETLIMPDFEPHVRKALLEETFFQKRCPQCGRTNIFFHLVLYVDKQHHFILLIKPKEDVCAADQSLFAQDTTSKKRYITKVEDVVDKLRILEDELDDRVIELLKVKLNIRAYRQGRNLSQVRYHDKDADTLWFDLIEGDTCDIVGIPLSNYHTLAKQLPSLGEGFHEIDSAWALAYLKQERT